MLPSNCLHSELALGLSIVVGNQLLVSLVPRVAAGSVFVYIHMLVY